MSSFSRRSKASSVYPSSSSSRQKGYVFGSRHSSGVGRTAGRYSREVDLRSKNLRRQSLKSVSDAVGNVRCAAREIRVVAHERGNLFRLYQLSGSGVILRDSREPNVDLLPQTWIAPADAEQQKGPCVLNVTLRRHSQNISRRGFSSRNPWRWLRLQECLRVIGRRHSKLATLVGPCDKALRLNSFSTDATCRVRQQGCHGRL